MVGRSDGVRMVKRRKHAGKCALHRYHYPRIYATEIHHIWPLEFGGPGIDSNIIELGPTEHDNIHLYIRNALARKDVPPLSRAEKRIALDGITQILKAQATDI